MKTSQVVSVIGWVSGGLGFAIVFGIWLMYDESKPWMREQAEGWLNSSIPLVFGLLLLSLALILTGALLEYFDKRRVRTLEEGESREQGRVLKR